MAISYTQLINFKNGESMTLAAGDGEILKISVSAQGLGLDSVDAMAISEAIKSLVQAKACDARIVANQAKK